MKNLLKKLHIMSNQSEHAEGSKSSSLKGDGNRSPSRVPQSKSKSKTGINSSSEHNNKPLSGLLNWINSVASRSGKSGPFSSSNVGKGETVESSDSTSVGGADTLSDVARVELESVNLRDPDVEEEYQIKLAMELSAKEDPEAVQIEAVKQMSLGSCAPDNSPAELVAYRYWNYNALGFDDKILDGFYDVYGVLSEFASERMPSLIDLQAAPLTDNFTWEVVLVNRSTDSNLLKLEDKATKMVLKSRSEHMDLKQGSLVRELAVLVSDYMGGPVENPDNMLRAWKSLSYSLKTTLGSRVLPLGSLTIGLARHRALLFKVLADSVGIPCRLVKGQQCKGSSDVAMNFVKINDGREYIVDLMADPGTLIPSDLAGLYPESDESLSCTSPLSRDVDSCHAASSSSGFASSCEENSEFGPSTRILNLSNATGYGLDTKGEDPHAYLRRPVVGGEGLQTSSDDMKNPEKVLVKEVPGRPSYAYAHARSPSWTEGVSSPAVHRMKVKDVSRYMINATKENPQLAQKLHNVLLESGVVAPPNLFSDIYPNKGETSSTDLMSRVEAKTMTESVIEKRLDDGIQGTKDHLDHNALLPPLPHPRVHHKASPLSSQPEQLKPVEGLGSNPLLPVRESAMQAISSASEGYPAAYAKNVPVAAAAAAAAAVVASSMVVAVAKSSADSSLELPMAAAAKATAAAVVATTAAVTKQYEQGIRSDIDTDASSYDARGCGDRDRDSSEAILEGEKVSDRSAGHDSCISDIALDEVGEFEIPWEDITLGERIGLGSYGEVYRGEWNGTEVAVKKLLDQEISGETLEEFIGEVRIMMRVRHPNVVLFMGAVIRPPNLSIVAEFLPRGSLYRLIHRPNNQLDERKRLRMALDAARGMNYLHNCTPAIVHRDLKSPNLLVDKNWVVKVCDFGLSRRKNSTFLSSRSTAGTAEWMAPEVLRNEPSNEKCDVYSYGVILWELFTLQQPWGGMNPMQVVGAVGYQHRRLDIPEDMDPSIADIIRKCWETDPRLRPSFAEIMAALKPLQKPLTASQLSRHERGQPSQFADETAG